MGKRSKEKTIPKSKTRKSEEYFTKLKKTQKEAQHRVKIKRGLRKEFSEQHDLKIVSIHPAKKYDIPIWKIKADDGSEWIAVESEDDVRKLAIAEHKNYIEMEGVMGNYSDWVIEDNLDLDQMYDDLEEVIEEEVNQGYYKNSKEAERVFKHDILRNPEERSFYYPEKELMKYLDEDALIEDVIQNDGEGMVLARYDGNIHETPENIQYWRTD